ncbi:MAG: hypothetical protein LBS40_07890 [Burkholderiales bacterium]|nr:hypothetical protein [Burkholderiales bacterium]
MTNIALLSFKRTVTLLLTCLLCGCASMMGLDNDPSRVAGMPDYRVGDRWVYHVEDGYRQPVVWRETHEITSIDASGITVHITRQGEYVNDERTEIWRQPVLVAQGALMSGETRYFDPPLERFRFPMRAGDSWSQRLKADLGEKRGGSPDIKVDVVGWEKMSSPIGEVDALFMFVHTLFDDDEFWRWATHGTYQIWYAPSINNIVYAKKYAGYIEKTDRRSAIEVPVQHETVRLIAYTRRGDEKK